MGIARVGAGIFVATRCTTKPETEALLFPSVPRGFSTEAHVSKDHVSDSVQGASAPCTEKKKRAEALFLA
jgi:hypothetical protein